jgi:hypothetical protein
MRHPDPTLLTVPPLLNNKQFRAPFTVDLTDPEGLKGFWEWFEATPPALRAQVTGPVLARLRSFLLRDFVRATIGPPRSSVDMTRILDRDGILIARLPKDQLGEDTSRLLGSMIFASVWQAATARTRQPEPRRRDATVVIDEAHNILNLAGSVNDMLAEARGYHLSLVLAHQHLAQLPPRDPARDLRERPQQDLLHLLARRCPCPRAAHPARTRRTRPRPPRRLHRCHPARHQRPGEPRIHAPHEQASARHDADRYLQLIENAANY